MQFFNSSILTTYCSILQLSTVVDFVCIFCQAHAQTVDILVSEKSSLQKEISDLCSQLNESKGEYDLVTGTGRFAEVSDFKWESVYLRT